MAPPYSSSSSVQPRPSIWQSRSRWQSPLQILAKNDRCSRSTLNHGGQVHRAGRLRVERHAVAVHEGGGFVGAIQRLECFADKGQTTGRTAPNRDDFAPYRLTALRKAVGRRELGHGSASFRPFHVFVPNSPTCGMVCGVHDACAKVRFRNNPAAPLRVGGAPPALAEQGQAARGG